MTYPLSRGPGGALRNSFSQAMRLLLDPGARCRPHRSSPSALAAWTSPVTRGGACIRQKLEAWSPVTCMTWSVFERPPVVERMGGEGIEDPFFCVGANQRKRGRIRQYTQSHNKKHDKNGLTVRGKGVRRNSHESSAVRDSTLALLVDSGTVPSIGRRTGFHFQKSEKMKNEKPLTRHNANTTVEYTYTTVLK